jgi:hypothetical protein
MKDEIKDHGASLLPADPSASPATTEALPNMVSGNASQGDIEIRFDPPDEHNVSAIDEVVARDAHVHLERMDKGQWSLIIDAKTQRACFMINGKDTARSPVTTQVFWIDQVGSGTPDASAERAASTRRSAAQVSSSQDVSPSNPDSPSECVNCQQVITSSAGEICDPCYERLVRRYTAASQPSGAVQAAIHEVFLRYDEDGRESFERDLTQAVTAVRADASREAQQLLSTINVDGSLVTFEEHLDTLQEAMRYLGKAAELDAYEARAAQAEATAREAQQRIEDYRSRAEAEMRHADDILKGHDHLCGFRERVNQQAAQIAELEKERDLAWGDLGFTKNDLSNALSRAEKAESTAREQAAQIQTLREALERAKVCRWGSSHYCPNCDRSIDDILNAEPSIAALTASQP